MNYTLMHKDIPVVGIALDDGGTKITRVGELYHGGDLPVGVPITWDKADRAALNAWWTDRFIPSARSGLVDALSQLGFPDPQQVISRNLGLSLSDHYWVKPAGSNLSWDEVNFFENAFSPDVGDALCWGSLARPAASTSAPPDWTCDGNLRKRWAILDGKRCLVKAGSGPFQQQPFNEVIAYKMADRLGYPPHPLRPAVGRGPPLQRVRGLRHPGHGADPRLAGDANPEEGQPDFRLSTLPQLLRKAGCPRHRPTPWTK